jgi:hypothetical protein
MHKQACPYLVHFSMEIAFGPTLRHKVLLASVYDRKLSTRFSGLALYLIPGYQSCWQIVISLGNCKAFYSFHTAALDIMQDEVEPYQKNYELQPRRKKED